MPFVLMILGLLFLIVAVRGTQNQFFSLIKSEFWGSNSFVVWASALVILGLIAYIKPIRPAAQALVGLVLLVIVIANKGFFAQFNAAIRSPTAVNPPASTANPATAGTPSGAQTFPAIGTSSAWGNVQSDSAASAPLSSQFIPQYTSPDATALY